MVVLTSIQVFDEPLEDTQKPDTVLLVNLSD